MSVSFTATPHPEEQANELAALIPPDRRLIMVDGHSGVGKTRVAKALAPMLPASYVALDDHLTNDMSTRKYVRRLDRDRLAATLRGHFKVAGRRLLLDGMCLRHFFKNVLPGVTFWIYVQSSGDPWDDPADLTALNRKFGTDLYFRLYQPRDIADLVITVPYERRQFQG